MTNTDKGPLEVYKLIGVCVCVCSVMSDSLRSHGLLPPRLLSVGILQARIQ